MDQLLYWINVMSPLFHKFIFLLSKLLQHFSKLV